MSQSRFAVVAIGRNEGERLAKCLDSVVGGASLVVYVDSGSTDGSVSLARSTGIEVVELDTRIPITAAKARNEGFKRLRELAPDLSHVQFVDGDCEVVSGWFENGIRFLDEHGDVAIVCGRLRERDPNLSIYNMLCEIEWDTPVGDAKACGGNAMVRVSAFEKVGGYRSDMIAGEEPELCVRLRAMGWRISRLDKEMAVHDAAIASFSQWWKRMVRGGYAFAHGAQLHGASPERFCVRESLSAWIWGLGVPVGVIGLAVWSGVWALILFLVYPLRIAHLALRGGRSARENWWRAGFLVLGKFPELLGQIRFLLDRYLGRQSRVIEYK